MEVLSALQVENAKGINIQPAAENKRKQEKFTAEGHLNKSDNMLKSHSSSKPLSEFEFIKNPCRS